MENRVLVIGAAGAMGSYLVPLLLDMGYRVDAAYLHGELAEHPSLTHIRQDCKDISLLTRLMENRYDAIVDFMNYKSLEEFRPYADLFLKNTKQYVFLSTYRVYADERIPITEESPRLLDSSTDEILLHSGDYCIYKAEEENYLRSSGYSNYTILRPAIIYSANRFPLVTMEAGILLPRMKEGKRIVLPTPAMTCLTGLTWGGDAGRLIARLIGNERAMGETFTVGTSESHTWQEVVDLYIKYAGLKPYYVSTDDYIDILTTNDSGRIYVRHQLVYDRYFQRKVDNSKILSVTGMSQSELMPLEKGLALELARLADARVAENTQLRQGDQHGMLVSQRMDEYLRGRN